MDRYPPEAWERLGTALKRRRGQLGYGFRQLTAFAADRAPGGGHGLSVKTLTRLENHERPAFPEETLAVAERMYGWEPGSAVSVLGGGEPVLTPGSPGAEAEASDDHADELIPECDFERFLASKGLDPRMLVERFRAHRAVGHTADCKPPAKPEREAQDALEASRLAG